MAEATENSMPFECCIVAGNIITVKRYEHLNVIGGGTKKRPENGTGTFSEENYKATQKRRREMVRNICTTNFSNLDKFVTLTFRDGLDFDIRNVQECNHRFKLFIMRLKEALKKDFPNHELKYLAVIEFQDKNGRGAVHYHLLTNLPFIKKERLADIWRYGFVKINAIDKVDNVGAYVSKYMNKDLDDKRLMGEHAYMYSRNLQMPMKVASWKRSDVDALHDISEMLKKYSPTYVASYVSENAGKIEYLQFNLSKPMQD